MSIDTEQLQIDLNEWSMQMERDSAEFARQLYIRQQIRTATQRMAEQSASDLMRLADQMRQMIAPPPPPQFQAQVYQAQDDGARATAVRFAPPFRAESTRGDDLGLYDGNDHNPIYGPN